MSAVDVSTDRGQWLATHRWEMERGEAEWLAQLAAFDLEQGWLADGQLSGAEWLMHRTGMSRTTAYEKLQVAHELRRRPVLRKAFEDGRLSYSAMRAMARMTDPDPEVDAALVDLAQAGSVADVERVVRAYQQHADQHRRPSELSSKLGVRVKPGIDGTSIVEVTLADIDVAELMAAIDAYVDFQRHRQEESARADDEARHTSDAAADSRDTEPAPVDEASWAARRAEALMDLVRTGLANADGVRAGGDDRYMVHVVGHEGAEDLQMVDGTPLDEATSGRIQCDAGTVAHYYSRDWEPVAIGRRTSRWTTAQRRAAKVRDMGHCRFPGCYRRTADLHHNQHWSRGGPTDLANGFLVCPRHHTMLHSGFAATGDPNHVLTFHRPDGTVVGTSTTRPHLHPPGAATVIRSKTP
jgi:HNH endonuclease